MSSKGPTTETFEHFLPHLPVLLPWKHPRSHSHQPMDTGSPWYLGRGGVGEGSSTPQGNKWFLAMQQPPPSLLVEGTPMDPATFWGRTPSGAASQPTGPAQPGPGELQGGGRRTPVSPGPFRLPGLLPMVSPTTCPQRKGTGQILTFPPLHPSLRATLQETSSVASALRVGYL